MLWTRANVLAFFFLKRKIGTNCINLRDSNTQKAVILVTLHNICAVSIQTLQRQATILFSYLHYCV